jgi:hypothetical protein
VCIYVDNIRSGEQTRSNNGSTLITQSSPLVPGKRSCNHL